MRGCSTGFAVSVADLDATAALLGRNAVAFTQQSDVLALTLRGMRLEFRR